MKITKKAEQLLIKVFTYRGKCSFSGCSTCEGSYPLWGQLVLAGLVKQQPYKSPLGHPFSYDLTSAGREYIEKTLQESL